ncbi:unnamed protein product [Schistosoma spindalis]|nr:unnamed protein product [Schistosoma spindale]
MDSEEKCDEFKTFAEEDITNLDNLIAKIYENVKSLNNGLFIYDFAARNVDGLISIAKTFNALLSF